MKWFHNLPLQRLGLTLGSAVAMGFWETKQGLKFKLGEVFFIPPLPREALWALLTHGE